MNGWTLTRVWQVDHELVVAKTIEEAIELFKTHMGNELMDEPKKVIAIGTDNYIADYDALIKEETSTHEVKDVDLKFIIEWFDHIAQIADDRMTLTNQRMTDSYALDEIKRIAKNSSEFITKHYKVQKEE